MFTTMLWYYRHSWTSLIFRNTTNWYRPSRVRYKHNAGVERGGGASKRVGGCMCGHQGDAGRYRSWGCWMGEEARGFTIHLPPRLNGRPRSAASLLLHPLAPRSPPAPAAPTRLLPRDTFPNSPSESSRRHSVCCFESNQIRRMRGRPCPVQSTVDSLPPTQWCQIRGKSPNILPYQEHFVLQIVVTFAYYISTSYLKVNIIITYIMIII